MLLLTRRIGKTIHIGGDIEVTVKINVLLYSWRKALQ